MLLLLLMASDVVATFEANYTVHGYYSAIF